MTEQMKQTTETEQTTRPTETPAILGSAEELKSFLVPSYGFERQEDAEVCLADTSTSIYPGQVFGVSNTFAPIFGGRRSYVPRMSASYGRWLTTELLAHPDFRSESKPIWETLRPKGRPMPVGAYNVALLTEGRRQFFRSHRQTTKDPGWWYRISDGFKDCYAVWSRKDGSEMTGAIIEEGSTRVYTARSGRGVIFARVTEFDNSGRPANTRIEIVRVEFNIFDGDPVKGDAMRVRIGRQTGWDVRIGRQTGWDEGLRISGTLDPAWTALIQRAREGFERWCHPVPPETEKWRQFFVGQRAAAEADYRAPYGTSFRERIEWVNWQGALREVHEPWQLAVVASRHGRSMGFSEDGVYATPCETVPEMIRRHDCSEERRAELMQMLGYVAATDNIFWNWNYRGD